MRPSHYEVSFTAHAETLRFDGRTTATLEVLEPTATITLHAQQLTFDTVTLTPVGAAAVSLAPRVSIDTERETATFTFAQPLSPGRYRLAMAYGGRIRTQAEGLFAVDYTSEGKSKRALYTQFESASARRFMPCWDEPEYKATFALEAIVPEGQMAVSNMPALRSSRLADGSTRVVFAPTPKMSSYLLFFASGEFDRATAPEGATEVGVVTRRGIVEQARPALIATQAVLREYNEYFGAPYPLPKLDNVAAPAQGSFGAMENWGAIFSFEHAMLVDPARSTQEDRQRIFGTAAHEIAHQWFGDLVTMHWWDDIWLNESFATWMAQRTTQKLHPEWRRELATVEARSQAMALDAGSGTHSIVQHAAHVRQASQLFDAISYLKGAAVIRMLEAYVGADAWRDGVRAYVDAHAYGNAGTDDLWRAMGRPSGRPLRDIADDFTRQAGVPLVRVVSSVCTEGTTRLQLEQAEFRNEESAQAAKRWRVPVVARSVGSAAVQTVLTNGQGSVAVPGCGAVIVNAGQTGYYRSLYPPPAQAALRRSFAALDPIDQLGLLDDVGALGLAGYTPASDVLAMIAAVPLDAEPAVWTAIAQRLIVLDGYYAPGAKGRAAFRAFAIARLAPVFADVGWQERADEPAPTVVLRGKLIEALSTFDDPLLIAEARRRFVPGAGAAVASSVELQRSLSAVIARHADAATWAELHAMARTAPSPLAKDALYRLLASSADEQLARQALELAISDEPGATSFIAMSRAVAELHPDLAFDFAVAHEDRIAAILGARRELRFLVRLTASSSDPAMLGKLETFAREHLPGESRRAGEAAMATVRYRAAVVAKRMPEIDAYLQRAEPIQ